MRFISLILGATLLLVGALLLPLPLPLGLPLIGIALFMLAPYVPPVQRRLARWRARFPHVDAAIRQYAAYLPKFMRASIAKTRPRKKHGKPASDNAAL